MALSTVPGPEKCSVSVSHYYWAVCQDVPSCDFWWLNLRPNPTFQSNACSYPTLKTPMQVTLSKGLSLGQLAIHVTRLGKEMVSLVGARSYRAFSAMEGRLNFT